ncbi:unnamed protein product [Leptidea sinapis]|uniref:Uncharacterized protein n=1 Tax=Leptidea sinapis TaxID=189913 RepID=A0A5E4QL46_9NEOP|nr:unnamed protein product [Leptidea sinapis]
MTVICQSNVTFNSDAKYHQCTNLSFLLLVFVMASLMSPSSPSDGYKRFSDDFANTSINNYGSNVASNQEAIFPCTVAASVLCVRLCS